MNVQPSTVQSAPCRRCQRRCPLPHRKRLCERCEEEFSKRKSVLSLSFWRVLGFLLVLPLIAVTWNSPSPSGSSTLAMVLGHAWMILLGVFAGAYLSKKLCEMRLVIFRYRFEQKERSANPLPLPKGLYDF